MDIEIDERILEKYPEAEIGFLVISVSMQNAGSYIERLKESLEGSLLEKGINATTFAAHPQIACWREVYKKDFHVNPKTYRSSLEALVRRIITGKSIWHIGPLVDLYNCCSVLTLLPMGGYDIDKISGNIHIRYAKKEEPFLGLGQKTPITASSDHVVYADDKEVICWLWNHKDSAKTCIDERSKKVIFFVDCLQSGKVEEAIDLLCYHLGKIGCTPLQRGLLNCSSFRASIQK